MDFKAVGYAAIGALIAVVLYDMFVKKALKLDTYESYESYED